MRTFFICLGLLLASTSSSLAWTLQKCVETETPKHDFELYCIWPRVIKTVKANLQLLSISCDNADSWDIGASECEDKFLNTTQDLTEKCIGKRSCEYLLRYTITRTGCVEGHDASISLKIDYECGWETRYHDIEGDDDGSETPESSEEDEEEDVDKAVSSRESTTPTASVITAVQPTNSSTQTLGNASATTDHLGRSDDTIIGVAVGGTFAGVLATIIVVLVIVFISRKRSRSKSSALQETITMDTTLATVTKQSNTYMYDRSKGFGDSLAGEYNNSGFYMEIEDADVVGQNTSNHSAVVHMNSTARGRRQSDTYQEICDLHMNRARVEIPDIVTDLPSVRDSMTYDTIDDVKAEASGDVRDSSAPDTCASLESQNSLLNNPHRQLSIVKSTDEIVLQENDLYEGCDDTVFEVNDIYEGAC